MNIKLICGLCLVALYSGVTHASGATFKRVDQYYVDEGVDITYSVTIPDEKLHNRKSATKSLSKALRAVASDALEMLEGNSYSVTYQNDLGEVKRYVLGKADAFAMPVIQSESHNEKTKETQYRVILKLRSKESVNDLVKDVPKHNIDEDIYKQHMIAFNDLLQVGEKYNNHYLRYDANKYLEVYKKTKKDFDNLFGGYDKAPKQFRVELSSYYSSYNFSTLIFPIAAISPYAPLEWHEWRRYRSKNCKFQAYPSLSGKEHKTAAWRIDWKSASNIGDSILSFKRLGDPINHILPLGLSVSGLGLALRPNEPVKYYYIKREWLNPLSIKEHRKKGDVLKGGCYGLF
jgi:hypothetical protein